jgi:adenylosuccinate lyase
MDVWQSDSHFREVLGRNKEIVERLGKETLDGLFDTGKSLRNVDYIFQRVGLS